MARAALPVAVAGCGRLAREVFLPLLASLTGVRVAAIADPDSTALAAAAALAPHARSFQDWRDVTTYPGVEAIIVALPSALHAEAACATIQAGRALYLEKPMAVSAAEAHRILAAHASRAVPAMVGFNYRFNALIEAVRQQVRDGGVGIPLLVRTVFSTASAPGASWRNRPETGGGALLDLGSHHIDLVRYLLDTDIVQVSARVVDNGNGCDTAALALETAGRAIVSASFATGAIDDDRLEITGSSGQVAVDRYRSTAPARRGTGVPGRLQAVRDTVRGSAHLPHLWRKRQSPWHEPSYRRALEHFVGAVARDRAPSPGLADGWAALATILAAGRAARTGETVAPDPLPICQPQPR